MSKSLGNYIGLAEPSEQIYGKAMSIPDRLLEKYIRLVTGLDKKEQDEALALKPRDAKATLARQLVRRLHGEDEAERAEEDFNVKFRKREIPEDMAEHVTPNPGDLLGVLVETQLAKSRGDARRLIDQGGVRINGQKASLDSALKDGDVLQAGKRSFVRIRVL